MRWMRRAGSGGMLLSAVLGWAPCLAQQATAGHVAVQQAQPGADPLDLNTARADQLASLPGMGVVYARRIVEGRPYSAKNQLVTRGVLPRGAYEQVKEHIVAHRER